MYETSKLYLPKFFIIAETERERREKKKGLIYLRNGTNDHEVYCLLQEGFLGH